MQTVIDFIAPVDPAKTADLAAILDEIDADLEHNPYLPFPALKLLHFASLVIVEDDEYGPYLIFENNFDGPLDIYLRDLTSQATTGLDHIYRCCREYSGTSANDPSPLITYLNAHAVRPSAYHVGAPGRTVERIKQESALRDGIEDFLDDELKGGAAMRSPAAIRQAIQDWVRSKSDWAWAANNQPRLTTGQRIVPRIEAGLLIVGVVLFLPESVVLVFLWIMALRIHELRDNVSLGPPKPNHLDRLVERENYIVQNHMASVTRVKPGQFRRATIRGVLWLVNLVARFATKGKLSGIPSIHFAHWVLIDNDRRLLFMSNFDGSWENYLDDFIDKASRGLTAIWSNTVDFPRSRFLLFDGARDGQRFKAAARDKQVPTNVFYSAYPDLTVVNIDNHSAIRENLYSDLDDPATKQWLQIF
ncbi:MAG: hypothetical protein NVS2B7_24660 [Herpetosiphon sp.]